MAAAALDADRLKSGKSMLAWLPPRLDADRLKPENDSRAAASKPTRTA